METRTPNIISRIFANPLAIRELRVACKSWKLVLVLSAYLLIQGAIFSIWVYASENNGIYADPTSIGSGLFTTLSIVLVVIVMLVFPAFSSTAIASEHEKKSFDLLLLTPLMPWEIALGKFFAAAIQASVFLVATVPLFAMANMFGGIEPGVFFVVLWVLVLLSILISFVGVYASSLVKKAIPAVLVTYMFAGALGMILLTVFLILRFLATIAAAAFPLVSFFLSPNLSEGVYYVAMLTLSCALYCAFLFLSTTNRLKPTSHNKSTGLRIFWTSAAIVIPTLLGAYFIFSRLPSQEYAWGTMLMGTLYVGLALLVPTFSAPAEAPLASRRVRREMERLPAPLRNPAAGMFFPGSARGVAHTTMVCLLAFACVAAAGVVCKSELSSRLDDQNVLVADFVEASGGANPAMASRPRAAVPSGSPAILSGPSAAMTNPADMRRMLEASFSRRQSGLLYLSGAMLVTLLVLGQITWRLSLSGISRGLCGLVAGLILVTWLLLPYIAALISGSRGATESDVMHFSPIQAMLDGLEIGRASARAELEGGAAAARLHSLADSARNYWLLFVGVSSLGGLVLLFTNIVSYRKVMAAFKRMSSGAPTGQAPDVHVQQALAGAAPATMEQPPA